MGDLIEIEGNYYMTLFSKNETFELFIEKIKPIAKYIKYTFNFDFKRALFDQTDDTAIQDLEHSLNETLIEMRLLRLIFEHRLSVSLSTADPMELSYSVKFVTIVAALDADMLDQLKELGNFYTIGGEQSFDDALQGFHDSVNNVGIHDLSGPINNSNYGHVQIAFYDSNQNLILNLSCHEGTYVLGEDYDDLVPQEPRARVFG